METLSGPRLSAQEQERLIKEEAFKSAMLKALREAARKVLDNKGLPDVAIEARRISDFKFVVDLKIPKDPERSPFVLKKRKKQKAELEEKPVLPPVGYREKAEQVAETTAVNQTRQVKVVEAFASGSEVRGVDRIWHRSHETVNENDPARVVAREQATQNHEIAQPVTAVAAVPEIPLRAAVPVVEPVATKEAAAPVVAMARNELEQAQIAPLPLHTASEIIPETVKPALNNPITNISENIASPAVVFEKTEAKAFAEPLTETIPVQDLVVGSAFAEGMASYLGSSLTAGSRQSDYTSLPLAEAPLAPVTEMVQVSLPEAVPAMAAPAMSFAGAGMASMQLSSGSSFGMSGTGGMSGLGSYGVAPAAGVGSLPLAV